MLNKPNRLTIDMPALTHNLTMVKSLLSPDTKIMGIVKSNAYGHGLLPVSRVLEKNRIDCLGVAFLHEALELRKGGLKSPIVILCGIQTPDQAIQAVKNELTPVLFDQNMAAILDKESRRQKKKTCVYLKIDTGMSRLGVSCENAVLFAKKIASFKNLDVKGILSHLSSADDPETDFTEKQIQLFKTAVQAVKSTGLAIPWNSLANSGGIMRHKASHFEMVRPGIMLYGGLPAPEFACPVPLKPVMHFYSHVLQTRELAENTPVSYARTYVTKGPRRIAVLSAGYGDGLSRGMSGKGHVLINGSKAPLIGRICMNLSICDITDLKSVNTGDKAFFLGSQGAETITGDELGKWAETISYEIFCSFGQKQN
jgi:alanine racemase